MHRLYKTLCNFTNNGLCYTVYVRAQSFYIIYHLSIQIPTNNSLFPNENTDIKQGKKKKKKKPNNMANPTTIFILPKPMVYKHLINGDLNKSLQVSLLLNA